MFSFETKENKVAKMHLNDTQFVSFMLKLFKLDALGIYVY